MTVEGLKGPNGELSPIQRAFIEEAAVQCGFCTPGLIMSAVEIVGTGKKYNREELKKLISGHLCRCTGYVFSSKRREEFSVSHCGIQKPQCGIHISHCEIQIPHCETENMQRDFKKYLPELQLILPKNQSDEVSGAYSCNVNSPRSTPKAFMANAPISSSPGITTIGTRPSSHSRNPWMQ